MAEKKQYTVEVVMCHDDEKGTPYATITLFAENASLALDTAGFMMKSMPARLHTSFWLTVSDETKKSGMLLAHDDADPRDWLTLTSVSYDTTTNKLEFHGVERVEEWW